MEYKCSLGEDSHVSWMQAQYRAVCLSPPFPLVASLISETGWMKGALSWSCIQGRDTHTSTFFGAPFDGHWAKRRDFHLGLDT